MFAPSPDGTRIVYERIGDGRPLVMLHGGFIQDRRAWRDAGYVERLAGEFTLLLVDLRGHGESDRPAGSAAYTAEKLSADVVAVLDAERVDRARMWGFSFGASVALQAATSSARVERVVLGGAQLGRWISPEAAEKTLAGIRSLAEARQRGTLEELPIPEMQKVFARKADFEVAAAATQAMAEWPTIEPEALRVPALFYAGSANPWGVATLREREARLAAAGHQWTVLDGVDHMGELEAIDRVLPACLDFLRG